MGKRGVGIRRCRGSNHHQDGKWGSAQEFQLSRQKEK